MNRLTKELSEFMAVNRVDRSRMSLVWDITDLSQVSQSRIYRLALHKDNVSKGKENHFGENQFNKCVGQLTSIFLQHALDAAFVENNAEGLSIQYSNKNKTY